MAMSSAIRSSVNSSTARPGSTAPCRLRSNPGMTTPIIRAVINKQDQLGETPLWCDRTEKLWWLDIERPKLQSLDPATGAYPAFPFDCSFAGSLALCAGGDVLIALDNDLYRFDPRSGRRELFASVEPATPR